MDTTTLKQIVLGAITEMGLQSLTADAKRQICDYAGLAPHEVDHALQHSSNTDIMIAMHIEQYLCCPMHGWQRRQHIDEATSVCPQC